MIHVNPSWIEKADILGYINTVTQDYVPAETNLFQHLIYAQEDYQRNDIESAIYPICFDEMNLAQIEHYFSDFMQILELPTDKRQLPCFSQDALKKCSMFAPYHTITLVPTLKFIGTVNFDETTRRLSDRLLDRANVIYLRYPPPVRNRELWDDPANSVIQSLYAEALRTVPRTAPCSRADRPRQP